MATKSLHKRKTNSFSKRISRKLLDIADRIHFLMTQQNISEEQLAQKMEVSTKTVSNWLGGVENFDFETLIKLEVIFETDLILTQFLVAKQKKKYTAQKPVTSLVNEPQENYKKL